MQKVLYISHTSGIGGASRSLMYLAKKTANSLVLVPRSGPILELYTKNNVNYEIVNIPVLYYSIYDKIKLRSIIRFFLTLYKLFSLNKYIKRGYTILHFNEIIFAPAAFLLKKWYRRDIKIVMHVRVPMPVHRLGLSQRLYKYFIRSSSDYIIAIGPEELSFFEDLGNSLLLVNPVDFEGYRPSYEKTDYLCKTYNIPSNNIIAGIFGVLHKGKGHNFLIDFLISHSIERPLTVFIFGEGPLLEELQTKAAQNKTNTQIVFAGFVNNVYECMEGCDFVIRCEEFGYLGRDILEANSLGVPILTSLSDKVDYRELVEEGFNGFGYMANSQEHFQLNLNRMLDNFRTLRGNTVRYKRGYILAEEYAQKINDVYKKLRSSQFVRC